MERKILNLLIESLSSVNNVIINIHEDAVEFINVTDSQMDFSR